MTGGVMANTSRMTALMNGRIINARMMPAVNMPMPICAPLNNGKKPKYFAKNGWMRSDMNGAKTNSPHMPKMMLGTAASNSIAPPTMRLRRGCANSTRNKAIATLSGTAISSASAVEITVP